MGSLRMYRSGDDAPLRRFPDGCFIRTYCDKFSPVILIFRNFLIVSTQGQSVTVPVINPSQFF